MEKGVMEVSYGGKRGGTSPPGKIRIANRECRHLLAFYFTQNKYFYKNPNLANKFLTFHPPKLLMVLT